MKAKRYSNNIMQILNGVNMWCCIKIFTVQIFARILNKESQKTNLGSLRSRKTCLSEGVQKVCIFYLKGKKFSKNHLNCLFE